jgi:hypothetical protein
MLPYYAGCRDARKNLADTYGPPLEPVYYAFAAGADARRICLHPLSYHHGRIPEFAFLLKLLKEKHLLNLHFTNPGSPAS